MFSATTVRLCQNTVLVVCLLLAAPCFASGNEPSSASDYLKIVASSSLQHPAARPYRLRLSFELYDLQGVPVENGTVDERWDISRTYLHVASPSLTEDVLARDDTQIERVSREDALITMVLDALAHPMGLKAFDPDTVYGSALPSPEPNAACFHIVSSSLPTSNAPIACMGNDDHIAALYDALSVHFYGPKDFNGQQMPTEIQIKFGAKIAIRAQIVELSFMPNPDVGKTHAERFGTRSNAVEVSPGHFLNKPMPKFPAKARAKKIYGAVVIDAVIGENGTITALDPLASDDPLLTEACVEAVRNWTYQPYLLNAKPTSVRTTITVRFDPKK